MQAEAQERLERLLSYLDQDPENVPLLRDVAQAAMAAAAMDQAKALYGRLKQLGELSEADSNDWAIAAMRSGEPKLAAATFAGLLETAPGDQALKFNLAWARSLAGDEEGARSLLDEELVDALPQAAQLEVHLLHAAGKFDEAAERAKAHLARHGDYSPLLAATSVLALDIEDEVLARECAERAGAHPDALTTLATLTLGDADPDRARALFERSLTINAQSPRAWVGLGLTDLVAGKSVEAGEKIDRGAELFGDHLGSWIAAGWAYLIAGDLSKARARFEHAVELDGTFAECQGSLAVTEILMGEGEAAKGRVEIALRLDRQCFSAAFANMLLAAVEGDPEKGRRFIEIALKQPIGESKRTIVDMVTRMAR
ncbi:MAG: tetratricopeptide repeat protein [Candidatus Andeanibacterium colombiense]|uniref:Tetratricopeptide repeat protein n=1 Tax=Candidatus Andeanibacterium colombiense TaxID=3121345 RepID=A0AAJ6BQQ6_9SPHN|nr:MAG: tetratricopeptide repeat protein [Sphingomonadaceae bacterium]